MQLNQKDVEPHRITSHSSNKLSTQEKVALIFSRSKKQISSISFLQDGNMWNHFYKWFPAAVLVGSVTTTGILYKKEQRVLIDEIQAEYINRGNDISSHVKRSMESYEQVMLGVSGLFGQEKIITKEVFENYLEKLNLEKNFYGLQEIHYAPVVLANEKEDYLGRVRKGGLSHYDIFPEGERSYYVPYLYSKLFGKGKNRHDAKLGYDSASDKDFPLAHDSEVGIRFAAMSQARDTGKMTLSGKTIEQFDEKQEVQEKNFHIYMPIFRYNSSITTTEERQKNLIGYIDSTFSMTTFFENIVPKNNKIDIDVFDGDMNLNQKLLYTSAENSENQYQVAISSEKLLDIGGHFWKLQLKSPTSFESHTRMNKIYSLAQGRLLGSFLLSLLIAIAIRSRVHGILALNKERELRDEGTELNKHLEETLLSLSDYINVLNTYTLVSTTDLEGRITDVNEEFCRISKYSREELIGKNHRMLKSEIHSDDTFKKMWSDISIGNSWRGETCNKAKDGSLYWVDTYIIPKKNADGGITGYMAIFINITDRKNAETEVQELASYDKLTNLPNRSLMLDRLKQAIGLSERNLNQGALLFIDLDRFKIVNDSYGHHTGDLLLQEVTQRMKLIVRNTDTIARHGGDEFVIILPEISHSENVQTVVQKIIDTVEAPYFINGNELHIGASIGITIFPDDGTNHQTLLKNSDIAMYHAKENSKGKYQFFNEKMNQKIEEKQLISTALYQAIEKNEFTLHYQPVVDMDTGAVMSMEALIRWDHPTRGRISPEIFIPIAEENGLIVHIGEIAFRLACKQAVKWKNIGREVPRIAVNFSPIQFQKKTFVEDIKGILIETGGTPDMITVEVTEGIFIRNTVEVVDLLNQLRDMGFKISMDDFGMGYSSLSTLKRFPIDILKIDRSFVRDITIDPDDAAITRTIIAIAHSLKMKVIAEGVETKEQMDFLKDHHCNYFQGYYFSRPLPEEEVARKIWPDTVMDTTASNVAKLTL